MPNRDGNVEIANAVANAWDSANLLRKILFIRLEFSQMKIKKSGINSYQEYDYFELEDLVPVATKLFEKYGALMVINILGEEAIATLYNADNLDEMPMTFQFPLTDAKAGLPMKGIQLIGSIITYARRYLYMLVLDIVEHDGIDSVNQADAPKEEVKVETATEKPKTRKKKAPATTEERTEIKAELTNAEGDADKLQIRALKTALKQLKTIDPEQQTFVREVMKEAGKEWKLSKTRCEELINTVTEILKNYAEEGAEQ